MKLSFTTLGCPRWSWDQIIDEACSLGFQGIEVRGIQSELDIEKLEPFLDGNIAATRAKLHDRKLSISRPDTSCTFLGSIAFEQTLLSGRAAIDIAARLGTPLIRVFGDRIPDGMAEETAIGKVAGGMQSLGEYAEGKDVMVLLETHGNFAESRMLLEAFDRVKSPAAGILWDIANPYEFGETVGFTWSRLKHLVRHIHVKDIIEQEGQLIPCLPGQGKVPIGNVVKLLNEEMFEGWLSFEWEKRGLSPWRNRRGRRCRVYEAYPAIFIERVEARSARKSMLLC